MAEAPTRADHTSRREASRFLEHEVEESVGHSENWVFRHFLRAINLGRNVKEVVLHRPTETSPLLRSSGSINGATYASIGTERVTEQQHDAAAASFHGRVKWPHEARTLAFCAAPLIITFLLQYSIDVTSIISAGRLGKIELGAVSLANMSSAISCFAPFQGLATSLDTLCSQAYGSGKKHLVGIYCQRMAIFLFCLSIPIAILWAFSEHILIHLVANAESAYLASLYLKIIIFAIPGFAVFETGKRFLQAQGLFIATTHVLLVAAPINVLLSWVLVWKLDLGFIGAPIAVAITRNLLPILLILYVKLFNGSQCWGGFTKRAFDNWWTMIRLSVPGMIMIEAEWLVFEIMAVVSSQFGTEYLAAQSSLLSLATISYQIPFPMSIAASTRVANLIGAGMVDAARTAARVAFVSACLLSSLNFIIYITLQAQLPFIFTGDESVNALVTQVLPLVGFTTFFDGLGVTAHGLLRGIGKQSVGGKANLFAYYVVSLPTSLALGFRAGWKLEGLWAGLTGGLITVSLIEYTYLLRADWRKAATEAGIRVAAG
ncbi:MATE efflux family protein [Hypoxylon sp. EC38]|nr:MATE efflux family protein [Hypoxylon sp. EC38]